MRKSQLFNFAKMQVCKSGGCRICKLEQCGIPSRMPCGIALSPSLLWGPLRPLGATWTPWGTRASHGAVHDSGLLRHVGLGSRLLELITAWPLPDFSRGSQKLSQRLPAADPRHSPRRSPRRSPSLPGVPRRASQTLSDAPKRSQRRPEDKKVCFSFSNISTFQI